MNPKYKILIPFVFFFCTVKSFPQEEADCNLKSFALAMRNIERSILLMPKIVVDSSLRTYWIVTSPMEGWSFRWVPYSVESGKMVHTINFTKRIDLTKDIDPFTPLYLNAGGDSSGGIFGCQRKMNPDTIAIDLPASLFRDFSKEYSRTMYHIKKIEFVYNKDSVFSCRFQDEAIFCNVFGYDRVK